MRITSLTPKVSVGVLLFPSVEELDFAGPYEVFANANNEQEQLYCQVVTVGTTREIRCSRNLRVSCDYLLEDCPRLDLLVVWMVHGFDKMLISFDRQIILYPLWVSTHLGDAHPL